MYSRQEASKLRQDFWTSFGQYMSPILSAEGEKINWVNYKTGEKHLLFKMETANREATISIELTHPDTGIQHLYYEQLEQLKRTLHQSLGEEWTWESSVMNEYGKQVSRVYKHLPNKSVLNKADWPDLISFFKPRLIALDAFWGNVKYAFELLH